jgi:hypothetical protein
MAQGLTMAPRSERGPCDKVTASEEMHTSSSPLNLIIGCATLGRIRSASSAWGCRSFDPAELFLFSVVDRQHAVLCEAGGDRDRMFLGMGS